jgi:homoserine O-succinyltransferase
VVVRLSLANGGPLADSPRAGPDRARWKCAFVNNMPDGAFDATERQFLNLLDVGSGTQVIEVSRHAMAGVPRGERTAARIAEQYLPDAAIRQDSPDLLVVTGSNPVESNIKDEPYWADLVDLLSWGSQHVQSMLLSCLSAHAALAVFDGIERSRLSSKCTGVFTQDVDGTHPLGVGIAPEIPLPHSRLSNVPPEALQRAGYRIAIQSDAVGWSVATRDVGEANVVLVQGHPEYEPSSLLREYHRDARRYVQCEVDALPCLPFHCVAAEDWEQLEQLHHAIIGGRRDPALIAAYPFDQIGARAPWSWSAAATRLYSNWLAGFTKRSDRINAR